MARCDGAGGGDNQLVFKVYYSDDFLSPVLRDTFFIAWSSKVSIF